MDAPPPSPGGASLATISTATAPVRKPETRAPTEKGSGSGSAQKGSGSGLVPSVPEGCPLPPFEKLQWEANAKGGWEAWHAPEGSSAPRKSKTYLGYVGKRKLAEWERLPEAERLATVTAWVADRRREKGTDFSTP
jgi:hypothetical protein